MKNHRLSHIIEYRQTCRSGLPKDTVRQTHKALYLNIHDPAVAADLHNLALHLHGRLLRHQHNKSFVLLLLRPRRHNMIQIIRFPSPGTP